MPGIYFISAILCLVSICITCQIAYGQTFNQAREMRTQAVHLFEEGNVEGLLLYLSAIETKYKTLTLGKPMVPSLYAYRGVVYYNAMRLAEAASDFNKAVLENPTDTRSLINLGQVQTQAFKMAEGIEAYERAVNLGENQALTHLLRGKGWINSWKDFESIAARVENSARDCYKLLMAAAAQAGAVSNTSSSLPQQGLMSIRESTAAACLQVDASSGFEYTYMPGHMQIIGHIKLPNSKASDYVVAPDDRASYWARPAQAQEQAQEQVNAQEVEDHVQQRQQRDDRDHDRDPEEEEDKEEEEAVLITPRMKQKRLKVGIVSSDFGAHPVATLARGFFSSINTTKIELFVFCMRDAMSWWGHNISNTVENFISLPQLNTRDAAATVAAYDIEILIDLNGHTQNSGLRMMAHQPAPLQVSFLGLPTTTGTSFIDYYLGDAVALPPEHANHFTESISLLPGCYIMNDYAQLQGDMLDFVAPVTDSQAFRASRSDLAGEQDDTHYDLSETEFLFATLSNCQKLDPAIYHIWSNILRGMPNSKLIHVKFAGFEQSIVNLRKNAEYYGIPANRIVQIRQAPWLEHLYLKSAIDLVLDTSIKNGHTTGLDAVWAGIPTLTWGTGTHMSARAGQSILSALGTSLGLAFSAKDYEGMYTYIDPL